MLDAQQQHQFHAHLYVALRCANILSMHIGLASRPKRLPPYHNNAGPVLTQREINKR